jgi:hypothetical protein
MAIRDDFTAGEVLAAADLNDTFASKPPFAYGTATPTTTVEGFIWYDENDTPPAPKFWDGAAFQAISAPSGLVHIATESFSAVSSVSLNGCFTSTYDNYKIVYQLTTSVDANVLFRFRVAGVDASGANYVAQSSILATGSWTSLQSTGNDTDFLISVTDPAGTPESHGDLTIGQPHDSVDSIVYGVTFGAKTGVTSGAPIVQGGKLDNGTSYDGFTLFPNTGTMTGTLRVYGYTDS